MKKIAIATSIILLLLAALSAWRYFWPQSLKTIAAGTPSIKGANIASENSEGRYADPKNRFLFLPPTGLAAKEPFSDAAGESIIFEREGQEVLQIFIAAFDEEIPITKERIWQDIPNLPIQNNRTVKVVGRDALAFEVEEQEAGKILELWFAHGGFLYQVTALENEAATINQIAESWKFME